MTGGAYKLSQKWRREVYKMFAYLMFPVICFHYFNNIEYFTNALEKLRKRDFSTRAIDLTNRMNILSVQEDMDRQLEHLRTLEMKESIFKDDE